MWLRKPMLTALFLLLSVSGAPAQSDIPKVGDTYLISRDGNRMFRGSHRIYTRNAKGLVEVKYCGRSYWVRYATVAWTQLEVEQKHEVRVEYNWGKGWRPICDHPEEQVTLEGLGVSEDARAIVRSNGATVDRINRFAAIRESFNTQKQKNAENSSQNK